MPESKIESRSVATAVFLLKTEPENTFLTKSAEACHGHPTDSSPPIALP